MAFPFLDRTEERARLARLVARPETALGVIYGRRRLGKSRLLTECLPAGRSVYFVGDGRGATLQRAALAAEIARLLPAFDRVRYDGWDALLERWTAEAPRGAVLALDEFPELVAASPELPSLLQKLLDRRGARPVHLLLAGSSQRMMQGLVLDRSAPLFGRATELMRLEPLGCGWIGPALGIADRSLAIESYAVWGGVPRYWELAAGHATLADALRDLVLSPLGVLYDEPAALLLDDLRDTVQAASILSVVGRGAHRMSEVAGRLGKPATSLSRPLQRLVELGLLRRDIPHGASPRDSKRTLYRVDDPFLRFWFRFVEPNRSRLEARQSGPVAREVLRALPLHVAGIWEELARASVPRLELGGRAWGPAAAWWGPGLDRRPLEVDVVATSLDGGALLVGEAEWSARPNARALLAELRRKAELLPQARGRAVVCAAFTPTPPARCAGLELVGAERVAGALR